MNRQSPGRSHAERGVSIEPSYRDGAARVQVPQPVEADYVLSLPGASDLICTPISATIAALGGSPEVTVKFPADGFVTFLTADVVSPGEMSVALTPEAARTICGIKVTDGGTRGVIISDGESERAFILSAAFGAQIQRVYPICRRVNAQDLWRVKFQNFHGTSNNLKAMAGFGFRADPRR